MSQNWLTVLPLSVCCWTLSSVTLKAQIIPDNTLGGESSVVTPIDALTERIDGGANRGSNLFHSFREFNIQEGNTANFANPAGIQTIFSRVTGTNPSRLFGTLGVLGNANLFFINPNGIIFGPNAQLNISGSFIGSTANSIVFPDGNRFSATNPGGAPLLSIDVPIPLGLEFEGGEPGAIINSGSLVTGKNFALVGGTVVNTGLIAPSQDVSLLTVGAGVITTVQFDNTGTYLGQVTIPFQTILSNSKLVQLVLAGGEEATRLIVTPEGQVSVAGTDTVVETGDVVLSGATISAGLTGGEGNITIDARETLTLDNKSFLTSSVDESASGNSGEIIISAGSVSLQNSIISTSVVGEGNAGNLTINVREFFILNDNSFITSSVINGDTELAIGNSGEISISAGSIYLQKGSIISTSVVREGNAGDVDITATESIQLLDDSSIFSDVEENAVGNGGNITLVAGTLTLENNSALYADTDGEGNAGGIIITANQSILLDDSTIYSEVEENAFGDGGIILLTTKTLTLQNDSLLSASVLSGGLGDAGGVEITVNETLTLIDSEIKSEVESGGVGNAGVIVLNAGLVYLQNSTISTSLSGEREGEGGAGGILLDVRESLTLNNSEIRSEVESGGVGNIGIILINAGSVYLQNQSTISTSTSGEGAVEGEDNIGGIGIVVDESLTLDDSKITSEVESGTFGKAGVILIEARSVSLFQNSEISTSLLSTIEDGYLAGDIVIDVDETMTLNDSTLTSLVDTEANGTGGDVTLNAKAVVLENNASIDLGTFGEGDAGSLTINVTDALTINDSSILTDVLSEVVGDAGFIEIKVGESLTLNNSTITSEVGESAEGDAGFIEIKVGESLTLNNSTITSEVGESAIGDAGFIDIEAGSISLQDSTISTGLFGKQVDLAGLIDIKVDESVTLNNSTIESVVGELAIGDAGSINIEAGSVFLQNLSEISTSLFGEQVDLAGFIEINVGESLTLNNSTITSEVGESAIGDAGFIFIDIGKSLTLNNSLITSEVGKSASGDAGFINIVAGGSVSLQDSAISTSLFEDGMFVAGDIIINANEVSLDNSGIFTITASGQGGNIFLDLQNLLIMRNESRIATDAGIEDAGGDGGNIFIETRFRCSNSYCLACSW